MKRDILIPCSLCLPIVFALILYSSCSDDMEKMGGPEQKISFTTVTQQTADMPAEASRRVLALNDKSGGEQLYLHSFVEQGIYLSGNDSLSLPDGYKDKTQTRAAPVTTMYDAFGTWAYAYSGSWDESKVPNLMYNIEVRKSTGNLWAPSNNYYWPGSGRNIRFFAYAPYNLPGLTLPSASVSGTPVFSYTVPANTASQQDLLMAQSAELAGNTNIETPLVFKHVLTAVKFVTGDNMKPGTVNKITLKGVYKNASYTAGSTSWNGYGATDNFSQTVHVITTGLPNAEITTPDATFMMLPQTLPTGATIEILFTDAETNTQRTLTGNIAGAIWPMGKTVTYRISTSGTYVFPTLEITPPASFPYQGGSGNYSIISYSTDIQSGGTATTPTSWTAEFSTDGGTTWSSTQPSWLTNFTNSGVGGTASASYTATVAAQMPITENTHNEKLRNTPLVSPNPYNLSNSSGSVTAIENTANCYVINAPGTYTLPAVYGNSIKNSMTNVSSFVSSALPNNNLLSSFLDYNNQSIKYPIIEDNNNSLLDNNKVCLVWQDTKDLVSVDNTLTRRSVTVNGTTKTVAFVTFTVSPATIKQGNAIIAVRNASGTIVWSWHIWVTDYKLGSDLKVITNLLNGQNKLMPINLGWCYSDFTWYAGRTVEVRIKQNGTGGISKTFTINQQASNNKNLGDNPYYQWGRKDPMLPSNGINSSDKACYTDIPAYAFSINSMNTAAINEYIKKPYCFNLNRDMDNKYYNLWNINNILTTVNDISVIKTIYDPSPVGYCLPAGIIYNSFIIGIDNTSSTYLFNVKGDWQNGWEFYCSPNKTGETSFFPATGYRYFEDGKVQHVGSIGYCWSSGAGNFMDGRGLHYRMDYAYTGIRAVRSYGFSIRAVQE